MKTYIVSLIFLIVSTSAISASFPHKSAIYQMTMTGPMVEVITKAYVYFDGDENTATSAEWVTQKSPVGTTRMLNITKKGTVYAVDLDKRSCTKTNIKSFTDSIGDPEALSKNIKKQMGFSEDGACKGAGLDGVKYTSSMGEMCMYKDMFMLWQNVMGSKTQVTTIQFDVSLPEDKISVPSGINCVEGPDLSQGLPGMQYRDSQVPSSDAAGSRAGEPSPQEMEEAMEKAKEAMKSFGDMFK